MDKRARSFLAVLVLVGGLLGTMTDPLDVTIFSSGIPPGLMDVFARDPDCLDNCWEAYHDCMDECWFDHQNNEFCDQTICNPSRTDCDRACPVTRLGIGFLTAARI